MWAGEVGNASIAPGKMADLVLWERAFFGAKPKMVIKGGFINWASMGDPNASLPTPQPTMYRPMFGAFGSALAKSCVTFASKAGCESVGKLLMTSRISEVAVCCSRDSVRSLVRSRNSSSSRTFSIAMAAWSAKVSSSAICLSVKGLTSR